MTVNTGMKTIPEQFNFVEQLFAQADPAALAVIDQNTSLTYQELYQLMCKLGAWLESMHLHPEQRVGMIMKDSAETLALLLAIMHAGMIAVPLDARASTKHLEHCIRHSGCRVVVKDDDVVLSAELPTVNRSLINLHHTPARAAATHKDSACVFMYTSGTTGNLKAVVHVHASLYTIGTVTAPHIGYTSSDRTFISAKLHYSFGMFNAWCTLFTGGTLILHPGLFIPSAAAKLIVKHQVSIFLSVPVLYNLLSVQDLEGHNIRKCICSADRLNTHTYHKWLSKTGVPLYNLYGITEIGGAVTYNSGNAPVHSIGRVIPSTDIRIENEQLYIKAPTVGLCYWHDKAASHEKFGTWMPSGDIVEQDTEGNLYFVSRANDVIKVNGKFVDVGVIEQQLQTVPGVQDAVVVGKQDHNGHTRLRAFIVPLQGQAVDQSLCVSQVHDIALLDQLPRTENGKIQRYKLRELL